MRQSWCAALERKGFTLSPDTQGLHKLLRKYFPLLFRGVMQSDAVSPRYLVPPWQAAWGCASF